MAFTTPNMEKDELMALGAKMKEVALLAGTETFISREGTNTTTINTTTTRMLLFYKLS